MEQRNFSEIDWKHTPSSVKKYVMGLEKMIIHLSMKLNEIQKERNKMESQLNKNSKNSNKPPSSDPPFKKGKNDPKNNKGEKPKRGAKKGHEGHQQPLLPATSTIPVTPGVCSCGCKDFNQDSLSPFYVHQYIELPKIVLDVTHFQLFKGTCANCGKTVAAEVPGEYRAGYGPRLSGMITEISGIQGASREVVKNFCGSVFGLPISVGGIQRVIDRSSEAIAPIYEKIGEVARKQEVNHVDETSWFFLHRLVWLWVLVNNSVAYFMIHQHRSKQAFLELIQDWKGILVSDNYGVYVNWVNARQACLAHYIRRAKGLSESKNKVIAKFGAAILCELRLLCNWAKTPPTDDEWTGFYSRLVTLLFLHEGADDEAGLFARLILREIDSLWVFLEENGVEPTNNKAERCLRYGVLWRKRSHGTQSEKGNRWVERILSLKETCRLHRISSYDILVDAIDAYYKGQKPDTAWVG